MERGQVRERVGEKREEEKRAKLNPKGVKIWMERGQVRERAGEKREEEKRAKLNPKGVKIWIGTETFIFRPKTRSIFPKKRRLVKSMILDSILRFVGYSKAQKAKEDDHDGCFSNNMASSPKAPKNKQI
ncbi:hypothetical protein L484_015185 [Morus notabilis]|uniref:Uncharacterized protein n=1 Tax=Morus notabilis TaxID=981085 RepID=W9SDM3_9ROSA|nr:hypothetical protein L484_015185 [Morus notabilis]